MGTGVLVALLRTLLQESMKLSKPQSSLHDSYLDLLRSIESMLNAGFAIVQGLVNATLPCNRVPPEILAHVFSFVPTLIPVEATPPATWPFVRVQVEDLHTVPKVCRRWRDVALATPTLWSTIWTERGKDHRFVPAQPTTYFQHSAYLARDSLIPLTVHISRLDTEKTETFIREQGFRIRELHVDLDEGARSDVLLSVLSTMTASSLEHCKVRLPPARMIQGVPVDIPRFTSILSGASGKLRSLYLEDIPSLPSTTFPALTRVIIAHSTREGFGRVRWDPEDLAVFLSGSPLLEEICLCRLRLVGMPRQRTTSSQNKCIPRILELKRLRKFTFTFWEVIGEDTSRPIFERIVSHVTIPPACHVFLSPYYSVMKSDALAGVMIPHLLQHDKVLRVRVDLTMRGALQIVFAEGSLTLARPSQRIPAKYLLDIVNAHPLRFASVQELCICFNSDSAEDARTILAAFPPVRTLVLQPQFHLGFDDVLRELHPPLGVMLADIGHRALETLCVCVMTERQLRELARALSARKSQGYPLRNLVVGYLSCDKLEERPLVSGARQAALRKFITGNVVLAGPMDLFRGGGLGWVAELSDRSALSQMGLSFDYPSWV